MNKFEMLRYFKPQLLCLLSLIFFSTLNHAQARSQPLDDYKLGSDDVISVTVFDEPDLSQKEVRISSTGTIAMPLVGQIEVKGLSVQEAETLIYNAYLGDYLKKPDISITIVEYRQFYVNGEVEKPGGYSYREGMTVQRAITLAGGFTERASRNNIKLIRETNNGAATNATLNTTVQPGDVITVEESFF